MRRRRTGTALTLALLIVVAACAGDGPSVAEPPTSTSTTIATTSADGVEDANATRLPDMNGRIATTSGDGSGNRVVAGAVDLAATPIAVSLDGIARWISGAPISAGVVWVTVDENGNVRAVIESRGAVEEYPLALTELPPGMAPTLLYDDTTVTVLDPRSWRSDASPLAGHVVVNGKPIVVTQDGGVFVGDAVIAGVTALTDTRVVVSAAGLVALMTDPTDRLSHGVLGDAIEAESVTIIDPANATIHSVLPAPEGTVFEAISPMWADVDGDGVDGILVTASDSTSGARLALYASDGTLIAQAPPIGRGSRWLNQLGVAPLGPNGEIEVVEVRTPHIGGIVQWYRLDGDRLVHQAAISAYSTHRISSRNLDEGVIIDADGDDHLDVVAPTQDHLHLVALSRTPDGADAAIEVDLGAKLTSNLAGVARDDATATLAAATEAGLLLIWP